MAFHPLGTARADARPTHGVVDGDLRLHDADGVYVADGSAVPSALGVNPQLTIMALATRLAPTLLDRAGAQPSRRYTPWPANSSFVDASGERVRVRDQVVAEHPLPVRVPLRRVLPAPRLAGLLGKNTGSVAWTLAV